MRPLNPSLIKSHRREGASFLEVQIAAVVMSIALAGMTPLMVLNMRQASKFRDQIPSDPIRLAPAEGWRPNLGVAAVVNPEGGAYTSTNMETVIVDDGSVDFDTEGWPWYQYNQPGYDGDFRLFYEHKYSKLGYYYLHLQPGAYDIYITYPVYSFLSDKVEYHIHDEKHHRGKLDLDQSKPHEDFAYNGKMWTLLGSYMCESGPLEVRVKNKRKKWAIADAICAVPRLNVLDLQSVERDRLADKVSLRVFTEDEITRKFEEDNDDKDKDKDKESKKEKERREDADKDDFDEDLDEDKEDRKEWKEESKRLKDERKAREKAEKERQKEEEKRAKEEEKRAKEEQKDKD